MLPPVYPRDSRSSTGSSPMVRKEKWLLWQTTTPPSFERWRSSFIPFTSRVHGGPEGTFHVFGNFLSDTSVREPHRSDICHMVVLLLDIHIIISYHRRIFNHDLLFFFILLPENTPPGRIFTLVETMSLVHRKA